MKKKKLNANIYLKVAETLEDSHHQFTCLLIDEITKGNHKYRNEYEKLFELKKRSFHYDYTNGKTSLLTEEEAYPIRILALLFAAHLAELGEL